MSRLVFLCVMALMLSACQPVTSAPTPLPMTAASAEISMQRPSTPIPTALVLASATPSSPPSATPLVLAVVPPTQTASPTATFAPTTTFTVAPPDVASVTMPRADHYILSRPIAREPGSDRVDYIDRTYPYGGTQSGVRDVHLGVEFVNRRFTPVLAAEAGRVVFAGDDSETMIGPALGYYGNVVIVAHAPTTLDGLQLFTLYGHLQDIAVAEGDTVGTGDRLGRVGDSGIAIGPHLHFEVRAGDPFDYQATRNPALWLRPFPGHGTLAGIVRAGDDPQEAYGQVILVRSQRLNWEAYVYGGDRANPDPVWGENFVLPDLPADRYEVIVSDERGRRLFSQQVDIEAGQTAWVEIDLTQ